MQHQNPPTNALAATQGTSVVRTGCLQDNRVEHLTQRLSLPGTGGRVYLLDLSIDPVTHYVLRYRLRPLPPGTSAVAMPA
jgi:hypothetical protein